MKKLNLPDFDYEVRSIENRTEIFDNFRKKYVVLTPEEWVRQHLLHFLVTEKKYVASRIAVETGLKYNRLQKRADILYYNSQQQPHLLVECKAPNVKITQAVFEQIALYNMRFKFKYLMVSNGIEHYCCEMNYDTDSFFFLKDIPEGE